MSENQNKKRERGPNYTPEEKTLLADLMMQYKHIIEDKRSGAIFFAKKKEAWKLITSKYNSNCTTGLREIDQLKALYDNMKQKSRKNVAESNKTEYIRNQLTGMQENVTEDELAKALQHLKEDKVQMHKTGGGFWKPKATDSDAKILTVIQNQVEPLPNPFDSGAVYFKDDINLNQSVEMSPSVVLEVYPDCMDAEFSDKNLPLPTTSSTPHRSKPITPKLLTPAERNVTKKNRKAEEIVKKKSKSAETLKRKSAEALKRLYFKKKCENALLERKKLLQEILFTKQQHNLKMAILKKKVRQ